MRGGFLIALALASASSSEHAFGFDPNRASASATAALSVTPPISNPGEHIYLIPEAAHSRGASGTYWVFRVVVPNPGSATSSANPYFKRVGQSNPNTVGLGTSVPAGQSLKLADVVEGAFGELSASGAFLIGSDQYLVVTSRTYYDSPSGTFGQYLPGLSVLEAIGANQVVRLIQLTGSPGYRTNIGFASASGGTLSLRVDL